jgi:osmotically inducible protein OsmC
VWSGDIKSGTGTFGAGSDAFQGAYSVPTRFEGAGGTNPEELIAAAHAACFSMALSAGLSRAGTPPAEIATTARCTIEQRDGGWAITTMELTTTGRVPGIDQAAFEDAASGAKDNCPVSKALAGNVSVTMQATLEG